MIKLIVIMLFADTRKLCLMRWCISLNPKGKTFERPRHRQNGGGIKMGLQETGSEGVVGWVPLAQERAQWRATDVLVP
jgi:hypothetical protein